MTSTTTSTRLAPTLVAGLPDDVAALMRGRGLFLLALGLLLLSSLPDAMAVPLLRELMGARYGVSDSVAHHFMSVNLIGGMLAVPLLSICRRKMAPASILLLAAAADGLLLLVMAAPIGFVATLVVRAVEGAADLLVFAMIFDLLGKAGLPEHRGRRMGVGSMVLMLGLASGMALGGRIGANRPEMVFVAGALANLAAVALMVTSSKSVNLLVRSCPVIDDLGCVVIRKRAVWPALAMAFSDRAVAGLMVTSLPVYFAGSCGFTPAERGWLMAPTLALMGLGSIPAGWLADRIGAWQLRTMAGVGYAVSLLALAMASEMRFDGVLLACCGLGVFGAGLLPTSLSIATAAGRGSVGMAMHRTAGDLGYLGGIVGASAGLAMMPESLSTPVSYMILIGAFALVHVATTVFTGVTMATRSMGDAQRVSAR